MSSVFLASSDQPLLVTPSDTVDLTYEGTVKKCRAISVSVAGDVAIINSEGNAITIPAASLTVGVMHPISTSRINATNTTATGIVAWF